MTEQTAKTQLIQCKAAIVGCGPAGLLAALRLAPLLGEVTLIGPESSTGDMRTTALMMPAIHALEELGIWQALQPHAAPLSTMRILDGTNRLIRSPAVSFRAAEIGEDAFGYNMANTALNAAIAGAVEACPKIRWIKAAATAYSHDGQAVEVALANNIRLKTSLVVAADGRDSAARNAAGISVRTWNYPQVAVVLSFSHELPHHNISTEFHTPQGPFTQVPLPGNVSSLVWVVSPGRAGQLLGLGNEALGREIEQSMQSMLGSIRVETPAQAWPMGGIMPRVFAARRTILIGEAAHVFPPIGAQGLNLGMRDVADLAAAVAAQTGDPGDVPVIQAYNRRRKPDIWVRAGLVHALNRALLSNFLPVQLMRSAGLEVLRQFSPLRTLFMREGMHPGHGLHCPLPRLAQYPAKNTR